MITHIATDENFDGDILRGLYRRYPILDVIRIQDTHLIGKPDHLVLEWITQQNRILLTHDARTMPNFVYDRIHKSKLVRGIFIVDTQAPIGLCIENLAMIIGASDLSEWDNLVIFLPFPA
jgi:hypothetical protein